MSSDPITMAELRLHVPQSSEPELIGWLSQVGDNIRVSFAPHYVSNPQRPTLSSLYRGASDEQTRAILTAVNDERLVRIGRLPTYFSNLLPEGHNRERLAERRGVATSDEFQLLAAAGHDLLGALEVLPAHDVPPSVIELHATKNLEPIEAWAVAAPTEDGFSLGGVVEKFSMVHDGHRYVIRRGTEAGEFIGKLPSTRFPDLVANESTCYRLAEAVGVRHAGGEARPIEELGIPVKLPPEFTHYLHVRRFDRARQEDGTIKRLHFEELAQAVGIDPRHKYKNIQAGMVSLLKLLKASPVSSVQEQEEVFRRWTLFSLMGGTDAHLKNWAIGYPDGINPSLAPAYDLVCVSCYFDPDDHKQLAQNRAMDRAIRLWNEDAAADLARDAGLLQVNRMRRVVRETAMLAAKAWPEILEDAPDRLRVEVKARLQELVPARTPRAVVSHSPAT